MENCVTLFEALTDYCTGYQKVGVSLDFFTMMLPVSIVDQ